MKILWVLSICLAVTTAALLDGGYNTRLNHFDQLDNRMVHFPYQLNLDYYNAGGPIFFYINDDLYSNVWIQSSLMVAVARETHGALVTTGTRFYGAHQPTEDASFENLELLTLDQSVYDIAYFIQEVKRHLASPNAKVILWGIMVGGSIAVNTRQKFPFLVDGAWSSSGIFKAVAFSTEYHDHLASVIAEHGGGECNENLRLAFQQIDSNVVEGNYDDLVNDFDICEPWNMTNSKDVSTFFSSLIGTVSQYIRRTHVPGITNICNNLTTVPNDPYTSFSNWVRLQRGLPPGDCVYYDYNASIERLRETSWDAPAVTSGSRQLTFAHCTDDGWFHTTHFFSLFAHHLTQYYRAERCIDTFAGTSYDFQRIFYATSTRAIKYGSLNPTASRVIFTHGKLDPWFPYGITEYNGTDSLVFNIPNYSQSAEMTEIQPDDSEFLVNVKQEIFNKLVSWATGASN